MSLLTWVLGVAPPTKCAWCRRGELTADGAPFPVCDACWEKAQPSANHQPGRCGPDNLWDRICRQFPQEAKQWVQKQQTRQTPVDFVQTQNEGMSRLLSLQADHTRAVKAGRHERAAQLSQEVETLRNAMAAYDPRREAAEYERGEREE